MAFSRITILLSTLILLIVFLFDHQPSTFVMAENQSISPTSCNQCVKAGNRSDGADTVGIAKIVVDCIRTQVAQLQGNMSALLASEVQNGVAAENRSDDRTDTVGIVSIVVDCVKTQVAQLQGNNSASASDGVVDHNRSDARTDAVGIAAIVVECVKTQFQGNISALGASQVQDDFSSNPTITQSRQELRNLSSTSPSPSPTSSGVPYPYLVRNPNQFQPPPKAWHMPWWGYLLIGMGVFFILLSLGIAVIRNKGKVEKVEIDQKKDIELGTCSSQSSSNSIVDRVGCNPYTIEDQE